MRLRAIIASLACVSNAAPLVAQTEVELIRDEADLITPSRIIHSVDEIRDGDELIQYYNYLIYHFDDGTAHVVARTYLDEVYKVAVYEPTSEPNGNTVVAAPELEAAVVAFLKRRFPVIEEFTTKGGYTQIWPAPETGRATMEPEAP